jgi:hypothetical protein
MRIGKGLNKSRYYGFQAESNPIRGIGDTVHCDWDENQQAFVCDFFKTQPYGFPLNQLKLGQTHEY